METKYPEQREQWLRPADEKKSLWPLNRSVWKLFQAADRGHVFSFDEIIERLSQEGIEATRTRVMLVLIELADHDLIVSTLAWRIAKEE